MNSQKISPAAGNSAGDYSLYFVPDRLSPHLKPSSTKICGRSEEIRDMTDRSLDTPEVLKIKAKIAKTLSKMQKFRAARALSNNSNNFLFDINEF